MKNALNTILMIVAVALPLAVAAPTPTMAQGQCLGKGDIQNALSSGQIRSLSSVLSNAGFSPDEVQGRPDVCDFGGELYYVVAVRDSTGEVQQLTLNAQ
jgi:hypothetical protein